MPGAHASRRRAGHGRSAPRPCSRPPRRRSRVMCAWIGTRPKATVSGARRAHRRSGSPHDPWRPVGARLATLVVRLDRHTIQRDRLRVPRNPRCPIGTPHDPTRQARASEAAPLIPLDRHTIHSDQFGDVEQPSLSRWIATRSTATGSGMWNDPRCPVGLPHSHVGPAPRGGGDVHHVFISFIGSQGGLRTEHVLHKIDGSMRFCSRGVQTRTATDLDAPYGHHMNNGGRGGGLAAAVPLRRGRIRAGRCR